MQNYKCKFHPYMSVDSKYKKLNENICVVSPKKGSCISLVTQLLAKPISKCFKQKTKK